MIFLSHGEGFSGVFLDLLSQFEERLSNFDQNRGMFLYFDEPEGYGLDITNLQNFAGALKRIAAAGAQVVIATHHPLFICDESLAHIVFGREKDYLEQTRAAWRDIFRLLSASP